MIGVDKKLFFFVKIKDIAIVAMALCPCG